MSPAHAFLGQLRHRFWGSYSCTIAFSACGPQETWAPAIDRLAELLPVHPAEKLERFIFPGDGAGIRMTLSDEAEIRTVVRWIEERRVDPVCQLFDCRRSKVKRRHSIDSTAHSIDFGPAFEITIQ